MDILTYICVYKPFYRLKIIKTVKCQDGLRAIRIPVFNFPFLDPLLIDSKVYLTSR